MGDCCIMHMKMDAAHIYYLKVALRGLLGYDHHSKVKLIYWLRGEMGDIDEAAAADLDDLEEGECSDDEDEPQIETQEHKNESL